MLHKTKVLVVDDSAFIRKVLTDLLTSEPDIEVIDTAKNGIDALNKIKIKKPDVITLDVEMPEMDGISCLRELQRVSDASVVMLSSFTSNGARATIEALEAGAIDFITKPSGLFDISGEEIKREIIEKIRIAGEIGRKRSKIASRKKNSTSSGRIEFRGGSEKRLKAIIAIGTSTGGPRALQEILPRIPSDIPAALLIVQHMPAGFTKSLAERLNSLSAITVKEGQDGEVIKPGHAYIAPGDFHMEVQKESGDAMTIKLTKDAPVNGHRPSVNVMMNSIAKTGFPYVIGVILTGMGSDGKEGVVNIKNMNKSIIICQDEQSSVVFGMPKSAIDTGVVDEIVPLDKVAEVIVKYLGVDQ